MELLGRRGFIKDGSYKEYYDNGNLKTEKTVINAKTSGSLKAYYPNGVLQSEAYYLAGRLNGGVRIYNEGGGLLFEQNFKDGIQNGYSREFDDKGALKSEQFYVDGKLNEQKVGIAAAPEIRPDDKYDQLIKELTAQLDSSLNKKIAVLPFSGAGKEELSKDGAVISERITTKLIQQKKFEIIERALLDKVTSELKLQTSDIMDKESTKKLGKILGAEVMILGTVHESSPYQVEVNARLIQTETAIALAASKIVLEKDWIGDGGKREDVINLELLHKDSLATAKKQSLARGTRYSFQLDGSYVGRVTLDNEFNLISQEGKIPDGFVKVYTKDGKILKGLGFLKNELKLLKTYDDLGDLTAVYTYTKGKALKR